MCNKSLPTDIFFTSYVLKCCIFLDLVGKWCFCQISGAYLTLIPLLCIAPWFSVLFLKVSVFEASKHFDGLFSTLFWPETNWVHLCLRRVAHLKSGLIYFDIANGGSQTGSENGFRSILFYRFDKFGSLLL